MKEDRNNYWRELSERYFDARTTEEEEAALRRFLASDVGGAEFNDVRAVIGFSAVGRAKQRKAKAKRLRRAIAGIAAAVTAIAIAVPALLNQNDDVYIAYIGGTQYTDQEVVISQMHAALAEVMQPEAEDIVQSQMEGFFKDDNDLTK